LHDPVGDDLRLVGELEEGLMVANPGALAGQDFVPVEVRRSPEIWL
jgi:hypothetical protein